MTIRSTNATSTPTAKNAQSSLDCGLRILIGRMKNRPVIAEEFRKHGARVAVIDIQPGEHFVGDIARKEVLESFAQKVVEQHGKVDYIINNAPPLMKGLNECSWEEFQCALAVGVTAPFYLVKLLSPHLAEGAASAIRL